MRVLRGWSAASRRALAGLAGALVLVGAAGLGARRLDPLPTPEPEPAVRFPGASAPFATLPEGLAAAVIEADPFTPARVALDDSDEADTVDAAAEVEVPTSAAPTLRLLGVVVMPRGRGSAALSVNAGPTQLVRVGQRVEGWLLRGVAPGSATLSGPDTLLVLRVTSGAMAEATP